MVLQRRLDYGFNGYQVPATPRAARSTRRRAPFKKRIGGNQLCAFDLLATIAGNLLLEGENYPTASIPTEKEKCTVSNVNEAEQLKVEPCDKGSYNLKGNPHSKKDAVSGFVSMITSDCPDNVGCVENLLFCKDNDDFGSSLSKVEEGSSEYRELCENKFENETERHMKVEPLNSAKAEAAATYNSEGLKFWNGKSPRQISSDSGSRDHILCGQFSSCQEDVKFNRDDDENSSGCSQPSTATKFLRSPTRMRDRRIRKLLASKYWNIGPKLKDGEASYSNGGSYWSRKSCFKRQRSQSNYPFKKRKFYYRSYLSNSNGDAFHSGPPKHGATGTTSSVVGKKAPFQSRDSYVKLRIKSFRVPELFIEIPETATVGALKRTVMETVSAILGGGLCVGVLLQGKKVRDDNKTLLQTGISRDNQLDALGFSLEPNTPQTPQPLCVGNSPFLLPSDDTCPLIRYPPPLPAGRHATFTDLPMSNLGNFVDSDYDSAPSSTDMSIDKSTIDSQAIVPVPSMSVEALAAVPVHRKPKRSEAAQRRIRRPFSVSEVEALVQAVEKLGTGRWRDVKLRAFDNAKHRTYVDLKDKWKTLVHTARISPQQRRGEPVPQEFLDRVLSAHAYWTQQAKHQLKHTTETLLLH